MAHVCISFLGKACSKNWIPNFNTTCIFFAHIFTLVFLCHLTICVRKQESKLVGGFLCGCNKLKVLSLDQLMMLLRCVVTNIVLCLDRFGRQWLINLSDSKSPRADPSTLCISSCHQVTADVSDHQHACCRLCVQRLVSGSEMLRWHKGE